MAEKKSSKEGLQVYELGYLILPSISEDALSGTTLKIREFITKAKGSEIDSEEPQKIKLAYTMEKKVGAVRYVADDAYIGWIKFEASPENVLSVQNDMKNLGEILRFIIIKTERETTFTFAKARELQTIASEEVEPVTSEEVVVQ